MNFFGRYAFSNNALANNVDQNIFEELIGCFKPLFAILQSKWDGPGETLQDNTNWIRSYIFLIYYLQYGCIMDSNFSKNEVESFQSYYIIAANMLKKYMK